MTRTLALLNPEAGGVDDVEAWRERLSDPRGWEVAVPDSGAAMRRRAERALEEPWDRIVVAGGDGTIHRVVQALADRPGAPALGVVPLGTANDFARSIGVPLEPTEAVGWTASAPDRPIDLLEIVPDGGEPTWCVNVAVGGFGGHVGEEVESEEKRHWGSLAYLRTAAGEIARMPRYRVRLEAPKRPDLEGEIVNLVVANGSYTGGGLRVAPGARLDDGMLDVVAIPATGLPHLARLATAAVSGKLQRREDVPTFRAERVAVRSEPRLRFRCDGERGPATPLTIRVRAGALRIAAERQELPRSGAG